ncbi:expressed unknown protein [Seminavis robusta]|uniref:Uncharacterized protein n=1 Tax=Seminavis robusta TaxID=568900 RepID=A0A9N8F0Y3_9STRA|nr:expressed unknown protein [Seminavis robusta]|eukprot:Sro2426_g327280.1 n/a (203) ;mRNA; f:2267-2875
MALPLRPKLHPNVLGRQMLYSDAMQYANDKLSGKLVVILNADIYLGSGVDQLLRHRHLLEPKNNGSPVVLSLTRHEHGTCRTTNNASNQPSNDWCGCPFTRPGLYFGSHDSFWFEPPLDNRAIERCQHVQNRWGAEHKVIVELLRVGYNVANPCLTIHTHHHHATDVHPWAKEAGGNDVLADPTDHLPLPPTTLDQIVSDCT